MLNLAFFVVKSVPIFTACVALRDLGFPSSRGGKEHEIESSFSFFLSVEK